MTLRDRHVLVGISGGIAAFKAVELVRELGRRGARVRVVMTKSATRFIGPVTLSGLTGAPPVVDLWDPSYPGEVHVELSDWAEVIAVAPATANVLARRAWGLCDDALSATLSCAGCPVVMAPAMHERMWRSAATQRAVQRLREDGYQIVGPVTGSLANGTIGEGRMQEPSVIADAVQTALEVSTPGHKRLTTSTSSVQPNDLEGRTVLVSAGPTVEDLDAVRFLSNRSSGRMGYALAERAALRGARVLLVSGPTRLVCPQEVERIDVRSALDMHRAIMHRQDEADAIVMSAAVADYRPAKTVANKLKKSDSDWQLTLTRNPDILAELGSHRKTPNPILVGFALETENLISQARHKLANKRADFIVANSAADGLGGERNTATLVGPDWQRALPSMTKTALADEIWTQVRTLWQATDTKPD